MLLKFPQAFKAGKLDSSTCRSSIPKICCRGCDRNFPQKAPGNNTVLMLKLSSYTTCQAQEDFVLRLPWVCGMGRRGMIWFIYSGTKWLRKQMCYLLPSEAHLETEAAPNSAALFLEALPNPQGGPLLLYSPTELLLKQSFCSAPACSLWGWMCALLPDFSKESQNYLGWKGSKGHLVQASCSEQGHL